MQRTTRSLRLDSGARLYAAVGPALERAGLGLTLTDHRVVNDSEPDDLVEVPRAFMTSYPGLFLYSPQ